MRLFESQKSRNERIFVSEVGGFLSDKIKSAKIGNSKSYSDLLAISCGLAKQLVSQLKIVSWVWGKGDKERGLALCEVCIQPALSLWLDRGVNKAGYPMEALINTRKNAISTTLHILGTYSEDKFRDLVNLDIQYRYDLDVREQKRLSLFYSDLLISKLLESVGHDGYIDWERQSFPVCKLGDICFKNMQDPHGELGYNLKERTLLISILEYYREMAKSPGGAT